MITTGIRILGLLLVVSGVGFPFWWLVRKAPKEQLNRVISVGALASIFGLALIIQDRITSIPTPLGTMKAATAQVLADAGDVAKLKAQAQTQTATINLVASEAVKAKNLSATIAEQVTEAEQKLAALDTVTKAAQATLDNVRQEEDFMMTVIAAQGDDRQSFDKLKTLGENRGSQFAAIASQVRNSIFEAHSSPFWQSRFPSPWQPGVDPSKFTLPQLSEIYHGAEAQIRPNILEYIWKREDIPRQKCLEFMLYVMQDDHSLKAMEYAGRYFAQLSGQPNVKAMALEYFTSWWEKHRHEFDGK